MESMEMVAEDLSTLCRLCGYKTDEMSPIFGGVAAEKSIAKQIHDCFPIVIRKIGVVSKLICKSCKESLQTFDKFWNTVSEANQKFEKAENLLRPLTDENEDNIERQENDELACLVCNSCSEILFEGKSDVERHENCQGDSTVDGIREIVLDSFFKCQFCDRCYVDERSVHIHKDSHVGEKPYVCFPCSIYCATSEELTAHKATHTKSLNSAIVRPKYFSCQHCEKSYFRLVIMKIHEERCQSGEPFSCNRCGSRFCDPRGLFEHDKRFGDKFWQCHICPMSFGSTCAVSLHRKKLHAKSFTCADCGKEFLQKIQLMSHMRSHTGEKPFCCDICDKTFRMKTELNNHKRIHTGQKPFSCDICDKTFRIKTELKNHKRIHTGEKPFPCDLCDKGFKGKTELKNHRRVHFGEKPFRCSVPLCDKAFVNSARLRDHMKFHKDAKPFKCNFCDKGFKRHSARKIHMTTHTGEKAFKCDSCDSAFKRKSDMKEHKKNRHGDACTTVALIRN